MKHNLFVFLWWGLKYYLPGQMVYFPWIFTPNHFVYSQLPGKGLAENRNMLAKECQVYFQQVTGDFPASGHVPKVKVYEAGSRVSKNLLLRPRSVGLAIHWKYKFGEVGMEEQQHKSIAAKGPHPSAKLR